MFARTAARLEALRARYAEPHRAYHTQAHVDALLAGLHGLGSAVAHRDAVELAVWYHDAVYDPAATDNEERSAGLLLVELDGVADPGLLRLAASLVRATADHRVPASLDAAAGGDAALFLDLDMSVLGADPVTFDAYERGIAAEYVPVHGEARYRAGRAAFLRGALARPRLFLSDAFHDRLDGSARRNLAAALRDMAPRPSAAPEPRSGS